LVVHTPAGPEELDVVAVRYVPLATGATPNDEATSGAARG